MILLTGAAGFIGSNILKALNAEGRDDIICVDDLTDGAKCKNLADKKFAHYYDWRELFDRLHDDISAVIHQGAISDTTVKNGREIVNANYRFSIDLLNMAYATHCPFVYASSAALYGTRGRAQEDFEEEPRCENPASPYAVSKKMFDDFVRRNMREDPNLQRVVGLRYFNVYGPGEQHKGRMASMAYHTLKRLQVGEKPRLFEDSDKIYRDFVYIDDVVKVVLWATHNAPSGIYNVGTGVAQSFLALAKIAMNTVHGYSDLTNIEYVEFPDDLRGQYQWFTHAHLRRLREAGYTSDFLSLESGMKKYWQALQL